MRFFLLITLATLALSTTAAAQTSATQMTQKDSVAYASGLLAAARVKQIMNEKDSTATMSSDSIKVAFMNVFSDPGNTETYIKQAQVEMLRLQAYLGTIQFAQQVRSLVDSTLSLDAMTRGIDDTWNETSTMKPQEASAKIVSYIDSVAKIAHDAFLVKVDAIPDIQKSGTGLRYIISERGEGQVGSTDTVLVNYTLYDMDGKELQTTVGSDPLTVKMPRGTVAGFAEGLQLLGQGGKATIYVPAELAYGSSAAQHNMGGKVLQFDIEVVEIKPYIEETYNEEPTPQPTKKELRERKKIEALLAKYPDYYQEY